MPIFYEFRISVADKDEFEQSENLEDMGIKSEPEWEEINCVINLDQVSSFHENEDNTTKVFFKNDRLIVNCRYEEVKEIFRKHYGVYPDGVSVAPWTDEEVETFKKRVKQ